MAIASPLLEVNIQGAQGILFNITGSSSLSLFEVTEAAEEIRAAADPEANIIFGTSFNERLGDEVMITVIATGFDGTRKREPRRQRAASQHSDASTLDPGAARARLPRGARAPARRVDRRRLPDRRPTITRPRPRRRAPTRTVGEPVPVKRSAAYDADDLEIPSFLRRK